MVLLALLVAFGPYPSEGLRSDGARYEHLIAAGSLANPHFAYLPLAALATSFASAHDAGVHAALFAAMLGALVLARTLGRRAGPFAYASAPLLIVFCPAFLAQLGAIEVHAAAFLMAAISVSLVVQREPRSTRALRFATAGFLLVLGHLSSALWLPALAWIAADAPRAAPAERRRRRALACFAGGAAGLAFLFLCGWWATPLPGEELSPLRIYLGHWWSGAARPRSFDLLDRWITEVAGALGPLLPLSLCGAMLAWRRGASGAPGFALALLPGPLLALVIGAFESGAYLLPGLPAVIWLAVLALRAIARARRRALGLVLGSLACELAARLAWASGRELPRLDLAAGDGGLHAPLAELARAAPQPAGLVVLLFAASGVLALLAGRALARRSPASRQRDPLAACALVAILGLQATAAHASLVRSPSRDQSELAALGLAVRDELEQRAERLLVSVEPTTNALAILARTVGAGRAHFLPTRAYGLGEESARQARAALDEEIAGAVARFPPDLFAPLVAARDEEALAWVRAREAEGRLVRLTEEPLQSFALAPRWDPVAASYAARAARELPPEARLVTCVPDVGLRGALAALHPRPFVDLAVDELPAAAGELTLHLCDEGLGHALALAAASAPHARRLRELRERIERGEVRRWRCAEPTARARADAFWESTRAGR